MMESQNSAAFNASLSMVGEWLPTCSVVICTRNRPEKLAVCLDAVSRQEYRQFEVVVVDNAPSDQRTRQLVATHNARYILEPIAGLARARNTGARSCQTEVIAYLDDDSIPDPEWLSALLPEFRDPQVMVVTGHILHVNLTSAAFAEILTAPAPNGNPWFSRRHILDREDPSWLPTACFGGMGDGGNMAFRRRAFDFWAGFDERLGRGGVLGAGEEHYAFFNILAMGYRVAYTPAAVIRHPNPRTMDEKRKRQREAQANVMAYVALLFAEQPKYRRAVARYLLEEVKGNRGPWRVGPRPQRVLSGWSTAFYRAAGVWKYLIESRNAKRALSVAEQHQSAAKLLARTSNL